MDKVHIERRLATLIHDEARMTQTPRVLAHSDNLLCNMLRVDGLIAIDQAVEL
jgi:hypothetical protein